MKKRDRIFWEKLMKKERAFENLIMIATLNDVDRCLGKRPSKLAEHLQDNLEENWRKIDPLE